MKVKELINKLLEFNPDAEVKVNSTGIPTTFHIGWIEGDDNHIDNKKGAIEVYFDTTQIEN